MECNVVKDLIPLYIDECCSEESKRLVEEHMESCDACRKFLEDMKETSDVVLEFRAPKTLSKINDWKASVLQSVLLFVSFAFIAIGVALEAKTPIGMKNGFWAVNLVIPATGFMLSLANWYFVKNYKNRKQFSNCSMIVTLAITIGAYIWSVLHYILLTFNGIGILLIVLAVVLSKILSNQYAKMLGKE